MSKCCKFPYIVSPKSELPDLSKIDRNYLSSCRVFHTLILHLPIVNYCLLQTSHTFGEMHVLKQTPTKGIFNSEGILTEV